MSPTGILKGPNNRKKVKTDKIVDFNRGLPINIPNTETPSSTEHQEEFYSNWNVSPFYKKSGPLASVTSRALRPDFAVPAQNSPQVDGSPAQKIYVVALVDIAERLEKDDVSYVLQGLVVNSSEDKADFILEQAIFTENSKTLWLYCITESFRRRYETSSNVRAYWKIEQTGEDQPTITRHIKNMQTQELEKNEQKASTPLALGINPKSSPEVSFRAHSDDTENIITKTIKSYRKSIAFCVVALSAFALYKYFR